MIIPELDLDIDQLHYVIDQLRDPIQKNLIIRRAGVTTAYLYLMLDEVFGGDYNNRYLYICGNHGLLEAKRVAQEFVKLLYYNDIDRSKVLMAGIPQVQVKSGQHFEFVDLRTVMREDFWRATHYDRVFIDIGQEWLQSPIKETIEQDIRMMGGDWV